VAYNLLDIRVELEKAEAPARQRPLVLMVDDDLADRELYGSILCYNGFDVLLSRSGSDAVTQARRFVPDCGLLDLGLPGLSGLEVAAELRGTPETRGVPLVVLSGYPHGRMGSWGRSTTETQSNLRGDVEAQGRRPCTGTRTGTGVHPTVPACVSACPCEARTRLFAGRWPRLVARSQYRTGPAR